MTKPYDRSDRSAMAKRWRRAANARAARALIGKKLGNLTVLHVAPDAKSEKSFICQCDCGREVRVARCHLLGSTRRTCTIECRYWQARDRQNRKKLSKLLRFSHETAVKKLQESNPNIKFVERYQRSHSHLQVRCTTCEHVWSATPHNLFAGRGCPQCKRRSISRMGRRYPYVLGDRTVYIQGYEDKVLDVLLERSDIDARSIEVASENPLTIDYVHEGELRCYYPDFIVNGVEIVEVKSAYTLLKDLAVNQSKAKACINQGYKFSLMLVTSSSDVGELPIDWIEWSNKKVEKEIHSFSKMPLRIMGVDPGTKNMSWSIVEMRAGGSYRIIAGGMFKQPINDLTEKNLAIQSDAFSRDVVDLVCRYNVSRIVAERFVSRGLRGGTIEKVNYMLGILDVLIREPEMLGRFALIMPAQWKNQFNRCANLESIYGEARKIGIAKHRIDAICIALYGGASWLKLPYFLFMQNRRKQFIDRIKATRSLEEQSKKIRKV